MKKQKQYRMSDTDNDISVHANTRLALSIARGRWQRNVIKGWETLGGSTLKGKAKKYADVYQRSGRNLMERLRLARVPYMVEKGPRGGYYSATLTILPVVL